MCVSVDVAGVLLCAEAPVALHVKIKSVQRHTKYVSRET